jgi:hypothetical protein
MSIALIVALAALAAIAVLLAVAATRPGTFRIERSVRIAAPVTAVAGLVEDFHQWQRWSPWEAIDPTLQRSFDGAARGVGAVYAWRGTGKAGTGRMEITAAAADRTTIRLDFLKPFEAHNTTEFDYAAAGAGTELRWAMFGPRPFPIKLMTIFMDMDGLVGKDFEKGLQALKREAEAGRAG